MHLTLFIVYTIVVSSAVIFKQCMQFIGFSTVATGVEIFLSRFNNRWAFSYIYCIYSVSKLQLSLSPLLKCTLKWIMRWSIGKNKVFFFLVHKISYLKADIWNNLIPYLYVPDFWHILFANLILNLIFCLPISNLIYAGYMYRQ